MPALATPRRVVILTPGKGGGYDPAALALFARMTVEPTAARKRRINTYLIRIRDVLPKLDCFYEFAAHDGQAARLNWAQDQYNIAEAGTPTFVEDEYYQGGASSYLRTSFNPATASAPKFVQNSASVAAWSVDNVDASEPLIGNSSSVIVPRLSNQSLWRVNNTGAASGSSVGTTLSSVGMFAALRANGSTERLRYNNTAKSSGNVASSAVQNSEILICGRNTNSSGAITLSASARKISMAWIGGDLTAAECDTIYDAHVEYVQGIADDLASEALLGFDGVALLGFDNALISGAS